MNIRIYQINMKRDKNNIAFMRYDSLPKFQGSSEIDSNLYDKVFEGEVKCKSLEEVYQMFNLNHPAGYKARSLSVSDVVEVVAKDGTSNFYFCDSFGFKETAFDSTKCKVSDYFFTLTDTEKISVLLVSVGKSPVVKEIPNTYEAMKELVGGGLDEYMPFDDDAAIVCNRDGKQEKLPMNRAVYKEETREVADIIHGDFFIARSNIADEKYDSLTNEQILKYKQLFRYPERFRRTEHGIEIEPFNPHRTERER